MRRKEHDATQEAHAPANNVLTYYVAVNDGGWWVEGRAEYPAVTLTPFDPARFKPGRNRDTMTLSLAEARQHGRPWQLVAGSDAVAAARITLSLLNATVLDPAIETLEAEGMLVGRYDYGNRDMGPDYDPCSVVVVNPDRIDAGAWNRAHVGNIAVLDGMGRSGDLVAHATRLIESYESGEPLFRCDAGASTRS